MRNLTALKWLHRREDGTMTVMALFFVVSGMLTASLAMDVAKRQMAEIDLQIVADTAAHAALATRQRDTEARAIAAALDIAQQNTADSRPSGLTAQSVTFGLWDAESATFTPAPGSREAVRVSARRSRALGNMASGVVLGVLGIAGFELSAESVFVVRTHPCALNGIVARHEIRFASANEFAEGFCLRSGRSTVIGAGVTRQSDGRVPSTRQPPGTLSAKGLLGHDTLAAPPSHGDVVDAAAPFDMASVYHAFNEGFMAGRRDYIPANVRFSLDRLTDVNGKLAVTPQALASGETHVFYCGGRGKLAFAPGTYRDLAILTDCPVTFSAAVALESVALLQDNPDPEAMLAPWGLRLGARDGCSPGGETVVMTAGGVQVDDNLQMFGATMGALGPVRFSASPGGMQGAAILSGQSVTVTGAGSFGSCPDGDRTLDWTRLMMAR